MTCELETMNPYLFFKIGSSADNIVGHFAVNYHNEAAQLGIDLNDLYTAMLADGELNPPEWDTMGRQADSYKYVQHPPFFVNLRY